MEGKRPEMAHKSSSSPALGKQPAPPPRNSPVTRSGLVEKKPGPNAFAQQEQRLHKHRLDGNAFYQAEYQKRKDNPPTDVHPAFREKKPGENSPPILFKKDFIDGDYRKGPKVTAPSPAASSAVTATSPFIKAGASKSEVNPPVLKLVPSPAFSPHPTQRAVIEDEREKQAHSLAGGAEQRTPVYTLRPTPKVNQETDFSKSTCSVPRTIVADKAASLYSPKKSIFDKLSFLKKSGSGTHIAVPESGPVTSSPRLNEDSIAVKAQAVLGESPAKSSLTRRTSLKKALFSRRSSDADEGASSARPDSSTVPSHFPLPSLRSSFGRQRKVSPAPTPALEPAESDDAEPAGYVYYGPAHTPYSDHGITAAPERIHKIEPVFPPSRRHSLQVLSEIPPTPPAKNTPPEETTGPQAKVTAVGLGQSCGPYELGTPSKGPVGLDNTDDKVSLTKYGTHASSGTGRLVTQPSMYSMHASIVTESIDPEQFQDLKIRIDGLGLEGFNTPSDCIRSPVNDFTYSPSMYENDFEVDQVPYDGPRTKCGHPLRHTLSDLREQSEDALSTVSEETHSSSSSKETITVALDRALIPEMIERHSLQGSTLTSNGGTVQASPASTLSQQYLAYSPLISDNPEDLTGTLDKAFRTRRYSELSPMTSFKQPDAIPAPLLQASKYKQPDTPAFKLKNKYTTPDSQAKQVQSPRVPYASQPTPFRGVTTTSLPSTGSQPKDVRKRHSFSSNTPSPLGPPPATPLPPLPTEAGIQQIVTMLKDIKAQQTTQKSERDAHLATVLSHVNARHAEMSQMYTEMLRHNARLDVRLENFDQTHSSTPPAIVLHHPNDGPASSTTTTTTTAMVGGVTGLPRDRVSTEFSHEFYTKDALAINQAQVQGETLVNYARSPEGRARRGSLVAAAAALKGAGMSVKEGKEGKEQDWIRELVLANRKLMEEVEEMKKSLKGR